MPRILVAEGDPLAAAFLDSGLRADGHTPWLVGDRDEALAEGLGGAFDLLLLEVGQPGTDGVTVLHDLRRAGNRLPVIVHTRRPHIQDVVSCLRAGADDYLTHPFRFDELLARIRARLRNVGTAEQRVLGAGAVEIDVLARSASVDGRSVVLTAREFTLLETLVRHAGQVLSREQLRSHIWGHAQDRETNAVNVCIGALRQKLGGGLIETVRGVGYRLHVAAGQTASTSVRCG